jgi:hypothetical protein
MKRISRNRRLTPEEAAKYKAGREQVAQELPDLIDRHHERMASLDQLHDLLLQLKAAREAKGLSLADQILQSFVRPTVEKSPRPICVCRFLARPDTDTNCTGTRPEGASKCIWRAFWSQKCRLRVESPPNSRGKIA